MTELSEEAARLIARVALARYGLGNAIKWTMDQRMCGITSPLKMDAKSYAKALSVALVELDFDLGDMAHDEDVLRSCAEALASWILRDLVDHEGAEHLARMQLALFFLREATDLDAFEVPALKERLENARAALAGRCRAEIVARPEPEAAIDKPHYYLHAPTQIWCVEISRYCSAGWAQALQYVWRHQRKNGADDLRKAAWWVRDCLKHQVDVFQCGISLPLTPRDFGVIERLTRVNRSEPYGSPLRLITHVMLALGDTFQLADQLDEAADKMEGK